MSKTCLKCNRTFEESEVEDPTSQKYPSCPDCWKEWTTYAVIVMNEMRLDMSLPEHRKALKKYERGFLKKRLVKLKKSLKINEHEFQILNIKIILVKNFIIVCYLFKLGISFINFLGSGRI